jgi:hypothetical protein
MAETESVVLLICVCQRIARLYYNILIIKQLDALWTLESGTEFS